MIEIIFRGHDNKVQIAVRQDCVPLDFAAISRMTLALTGLGVVADTDIDATLIDWSKGGGKIDFDLGGLNITPGNYEATLVAYDPAHASGQVLAHPAGARLQIRVVE